MARTKTTTATATESTASQPQKRTPAKPAIANKAAKVGKQERLRLMLARTEGATLEQMNTEFGWLAHSARAAISGLRKAGHEVAREPGDSGSEYRIAATAAQ